MRRSLGLSLLGLSLAGCTTSSNPGLLHADIMVTEAQEWVDCTAAGACKFAGVGLNEGPDCAEDVVGYVILFDSLQAPLVDATTGSSVSLSWRVDPNPRATLVPGQTFKYRSTGRVPKWAVQATSSFQGSPQGGSVHDCSL